MSDWSQSSQSDSDTSWYPWGLVAIELLAVWGYPFVSCAHLSSCSSLAPKKSNCCNRSLPPESLLRLGQGSNSFCNFVFFQFCWLVSCPGSERRCSGLQAIDILGFWPRCLFVALLELELGFLLFCCLLLIAVLQRCLYALVEHLLIFSACRSSLDSLYSWPSIMRMRESSCCCCFILEIWFPHPYFPSDLMIEKQSFLSSLAFYTHHQIHWFSCRQYFKHSNQGECWCHQVGLARSLMIDCWNQLGPILEPGCPLNRQPLEGDSCWSACRSCYSVLSIPFAGPPYHPHRSHLHLRRRACICSDQVWNWESSWNFEWHWWYSRLCFRSTSSDWHFGWRFDLEYWAWLTPWGSDSLILALFFFYLLLACRPPGATQTGKHCKQPHFQHQQPHFVEALLEPLSIWFVGSSSMTRLHEDYLHFAIYSWARTIDWAAAVDLCRNYTGLHSSWQSFQFRVYYVHSSHRASSSDSHYSGYFHCYFELSWLISCGPFCGFPQLVLSDSNPAVSPPTASSSGRRCWSWALIGRTFGFYLFAICSNSSRISFLFWFDSSQSFCSSPSRQTRIIAFASLWCLAGATESSWPQNHRAPLVAPGWFLGLSLSTSCQNQLWNHSNNHDRLLCRADRSSGQCLGAHHPFCRNVNQPPDR